MHPSKYSFLAMKLPELNCPGSGNSEKWACYNLDIVESCPLVPKSPESIQKTAEELRDIVENHFIFIL